MSRPRVNRRIRYEPDEQPPTFVTLGVALQGVVLVLANTVLMVTIVVGAAGEDDVYLSWAVFAALIIAGVTTALQAAHVGRFGAGHILMIGAGPHFIAVSVVALTEGGLPTLASLIVVASLFQFAMAAWLPFLRRIITPIVSGTALILIGLAVMPIAVGRIVEASAGAPAGALIVAGMTLVVATAMALRASGVWRLWAPLSGILAGCALGNGSVLEGVLGATWSASLGNGMTVGVLAAILMTAFLELTGPRRRRLEAVLDTSALPQIDALLREVAGRMKWSRASVDQLRAAGEEALTCLLQVRGDQVAEMPPRMILVARPGPEVVDLEFLAVFDEQNIEDRLTYLGDRAETPEESESEISFRLLRHYASSVRHKKYHGIDVVTVKVAGSR